jgi:hypothetical protein
MRFLSRWPPVAILCGLIACAGGANDELAGQPGLLAKVKSYYDRYAMEEGGLCGSPEFGLVTGSSIEEQSADRLTVRVSYIYSDPSVKATPWGQYSVGPNGVAAPSGIAGPKKCRGVSTRSFTVARNADGLEVIGMTGSQRKGIKINKIDASKVW